MTMTQAHQPLQTLDLVLLSLDLFLLFLDGVYEHGRDAVVLHAFDFTFVVARDEQRLYSGDVFRAETKVVHAALFPIERYGTKTIEHIESANEGLNVRLVAKTR